MNFLVKTSLGILYLFTIISASSEDQLKEKFQQICQTLKCNPSTEICRLDSKCADGNPMDLSQCVHCALKTARPAQTLLASSISEQQQPLAPRLLAKSPGGSRLLASNGNDRSASTTSLPSKQENRTTDEFLYDDYYEYDDDDDDEDDQEDPTGPSEKNKMGEEDDYLDDYAEPIEKVLPNSDAIRKVGVCPKVIQSIEECDPKKEIQSECRFDTDCPSDQKCCESNCGKRVCSKASRVSVSVCPSSFTCSLNCRLGYRTDSNGCLLCQCQSCPSMDQCQKSCPSGFLKDLFGCEICECNEPCPPFPTSCNLVCPPEIGYMKSKDGCPLCQCARSNNIQLTSSCQDDVHCPPGFRCLNDANHVPMCQADLSAAQEVVDPDALPSVVNQCPEDLLKNCNLNCSNGLYLLNENGCPTCACAEQLPSGPKMACPMIKCRANCPNNNYAIDENGCRTCNCASDDEDSVPPQPPVECSRVMCRMFCVHGFRRDENGCEICQCNNEPQPCPPVRCQKACPNGYRKDYSGCQTCQCEEVEVPRQPDVNVDGCSPMKCSLNCKYGFERDPTGCPLCSCNVCPLQTCRMFCMYGFKKNSDGCDICECNWEPVAENIPCSDRVPCTGYRVCNSNLRLCETVSADKVNWFVYNFDVKSDLFRDADFLLAFKRGLINNIAGKYDLEPGQITVTAVDPDSTTSFQIMPYYAESLDEFQKKIDQIDADLGSNEFRGVLPSVASLAKRPSRPSRWNSFLQKHPRMALYLVAVSIGLVALTLAGIFACLFRRTGQYHRTESKVPIYESSYQPAPTDDDPYQHQAVHAPDGTAYVVVESDEMVTSNDKRALV